MFTGGVLGSNWTMELPNEFIHQWSHKSKAWVGRRQKHSEVRSNCMKLSTSLRTCFGELFLYLSSSWPWRRECLLYVRPWCSTPHRPRNKGASSYGWKLLTLWINHLPFKLFLTSICDGDKNVCPESLYNFMFFPTPQIWHPLLGGCRFGFGSRENSRTEMCVLQLIVWRVQSSLSTPRKKAKVWGSGTTAGEQTI